MLTIIKKDEILKWLDERRIQYVVGPWTNFLGTQHNPNGVLVYPRNRQELEEFVDYINKLNQDKNEGDETITVRGIAGSSIPATEDDTSKNNCCSWLKSIFRFAPAPEHSFPEQADLPPEYDKSFAQQLTEADINIVWSCEAQKLKVTEESCELIKVGEEPTTENLTKLLSANINAAYLRHNNQLFYVNKKDKKCELLNLTEEKLSQFDAILKVDTQESSQRLSNADLAKIAVITGHSHDIFITVTPGVTIGEVEDALFKKEARLEAPTMTAYVSLIGATITDSHGTTIKGPSLPGYLTEITVKPANSKMVTITKNHPDFNTLVGAQLGLGYVTSATYRCVRGTAFEEVISTYTSIEDLSPAELQKLYFSAPHTTIMRMYPKVEGRPTLQIRQLTPTLETPEPETPPYHPGATHTEQSLQIKIASAILDRIVDHHPAIVDEYLKLAQIVELGISPGRWKRIRDSRSAAHYQQAFPPKGHLSDIAIRVAVDEDKLGESIFKIEQIGERIAAKYKEAFTWATYTRVIDGFNGGFSTSARGSKQKIISFEMTAHPNSPQFEPAQKEVIAQIQKEINQEIAYHFGKAIPEGIVIPQQKCDEVLAAGKRVYGEEFSFENNMFVTPHMEQLLGLKPYPKSELSTNNQKDETAAIPSTDAPSRDEIKTLQTIVEKLITAIAPDHHLKNGSHWDAFRSFNAECMKVIKEKSIALSSAF